MPLAAETPGIEFNAAASHVKTSPKRYPWAIPFCVWKTLADEPAPPGATWNIKVPLPEPEFVVGVGSVKVVAVAAVNVKVPILEVPEVKISKAPTITPSALAK